jgi:pimeloyl-ACP methyl ester carboxylesterase
LTASAFVLRQVADLNGQIRGMRLRICPDIGVTDLAGCVAEFAGKLDKGGHFAAWEQPQQFSEEVRAGFRSLRK